MYNTKHISLINCLKDTSIMLGRVKANLQLFWPHFIYLMNGGSEACQCEHCGPVRKAAKPAKLSASMSQKRPGRPAGKPRNALDNQIGSTQPRASRPKRMRRKKFLVEDAEGNQDVFKELVYYLHVEGTQDTPILENSNMEWKAERELLHNHLTRVRMQHSFFPRIGELVLWCVEVNGEIKFEWETETFQIYSHKRKKFLGIPKWYAGVVTQVPEEPLTLHDAIIETNNGYALNMSGYRIELFPDPNSSDKSMSNQYKYVPLSRIRPFSFWAVYLQGVRSEDFHPSIPHALTIMSSFSMVDKYHFKGTWPDASVYCEGIYLGSELLIRGDGVRLMPHDQNGNYDPKGKATEILVIDKILFKLMGCDADLKSPLLCENTTARLSGKVYTLDPKLAYDPDKPMTDFEVTESFECTGMREYGSWYPLCEPNATVEVSLSQVIGRCLESEYMDIMFQDLSLGIDLDSVRGGRLYAQERDERIAPGKDWFCGDNRLEQLALESLNGIEHSRYDDSRDPKMCRAIMNIINGEAVDADHRDAKIVRQLGRAHEGLIGSRSGNTRFDSAGKHSSMVLTALGGGTISSYSNATPIETPAGDTVDESGEDEIEGSPRKIQLLSDSEEDPISQPLPKRQRQL
ncbi:hypothetical protein MferCBS31731_002198 [Microsporum ferrugineum]